MSSVDVVAVAVRRRDAAPQLLGVAHVITVSTCGRRTVLGPIF